MDNMLPSVDNSQEIIAAIDFCRNVSLCETIVIQSTFSASRHFPRPVITNTCSEPNGIVEAHSDCVTKCKHHHKLCLDAYHAGCLRGVLFQSRTFCEGFLEYVKQKSRERDESCATAPIVSHESSAEELAVPRLVTVLLIPTDKEWLDYKWNYRILDLVAKRMIADDAMAWLNTLGGGYSALGDYFEHHAREAGRISMKQFKISMEMGDEPTQIRCRLYFSLSLMQTGRLREAAQVIRWQYALAQKLPIEDSRLLAMCRGIWSRLEYLEGRYKA